MTSSFKNDKENLKKKTQSIQLSVINCTKNNLVSIFRGGGGEDYFFANWLYVLRYHSQFFFDSKTFSFIIIKEIDREKTHKLKKTLLSLLS